MEDERYYIGKEVIYHAGAHQYVGEIVKVTKFQYTVNVVGFKDPIRVNKRMDRIVGSSSYSRHFMTSNPSEEHLEGVRVAVESRKYRNAILKRIETAPLSRLKAAYEKLK